MKTHPFTTSSLSLSLFTSMFDVGRSMFDVQSPPSHHLSSPSHFSLPTRHFFLSAFQLLSLSAFLSSPALASDSTHELRDSLLARGDFNGDGRPDVALVDRATGLLRFAHASADGSLTWSQAHHTGIAPATGVATGKFLHASRDSLAVTGASANRTNLFDLTNAAANPVPLSIFTASTGPGGVSASQVFNGSALEEIVVHHTENGSPPQARAFVRFTGSPPAPQTFTPAAGITVPNLELRPRRLESLPSAAYGSFTGASPNDAFRVFRTGASPLQTIATLNVPPDSHFLHADFDGAATTSPAQFIFYNRERSALRRTSLSAANAFSALTATDSGETIEHASAVARTGGGWNILVVFTTGWARLFSFDGQSAPVPGESFAPPAGESFLGIFAAGLGDFHLLAGSPGNALRAHRFTWNGSTHAPNGTSELPPLRAARPSANLFAFTADPFIATDAVLLGSFSAGEWTRDGSLTGGNIQARHARFSNPADGLGAFQTVSLGPAPSGTNYLLTNQIPSGQPDVPSYASAYGPTPALGLTAGEISIDPAPGRHLRSIRPRFTIPAGLNVFWRIGGGPWTSLAAQPPGWQFDAFTIEWYGRTAANITTPVRSASYTFADSPDLLDSDGDNVPDYVEIALGLDPVSSGDDADGDGASDLLEILSGTSPSSSASFPTRTGGPAGSAPEFDGNYRNTFNFRITPVAIAGSTRYATLGADAAGIALHDLPGLRLAYRPTVGSNPQHARIGSIQAGYPGTLLVAATDANFDLTATPPNKRRGRELAGLIPVPRSELGAVPHAYTGGALPAAANAWVAAARDHYSQPQTPILHNLDVSTTLTLLLVELKYEQILRARNELSPTQTLSLTPFRATETTRPLAERPGAPADASFRLSPADLDRLRRYLGEPPAFSYATGWLPENIHQSIASGLSTPTPAAALLLQTARELYFLSAAANDEILPQYPSPIDALRRFLRTARLPGDLNADGVHDPGESSSYWGNVTLTPTQLTQAHSAIAPLLALPPSRPTVTGVFVVGADTFAGPVPIVRSLPALAPHVLLQGNGEPWPLTQFAPLVTGAELTVTGFSDVDSPHAPAIEVISLSLTRLPSSGPADADNNLLGDDWENLFPGGGDGGPFGDNDDDGFTNLQEYLDGTDPIDPASTPPGPPVPLGIPVLDISPAPAAGDYRIAFRFPAAYSDRIAFHVQQSSTLSAFSDTGLEVPHLGSGQYQITLDPGSAPSRFWRIRLSLK